MGVIVRRIFLGTVLALALSALPAQGQVAWDSPMLLGPATPSGWGVFLVDPSPGRGIGALGTWRGDDGGGGLGYRLGLAEGAGDKLAVYSGIDVSGFLLRHSDEFPLDVLWVTGGGMGVGDAFLLSFPLGASVGRELEAEGVLFHPYLAPRVVLDAVLGRDGPEDGSDLDLGFVVDVGLDISFQADWSIRFAASVGDRSTLAIGVSFLGF